MLRYRVILLIGGIGSIAYSAATASWEARLIQGNHTWIMRLGSHPVWNPPPSPDYAVFRKHFETSDRFPPRQSEWSIEINYNPFAVGLMSLAYFWPVSIVCGTAYFVFRGPRRDPVLHCTFFVGIALTVGVGVSLLLWCLLGGWGPPAVSCFAVCAVISGVVAGLFTFNFETHGADGDGRS